MGKLLLGVLGAVAEFETGLRRERQMEGIAKAKAAGKYKGGQPIKAEKVQKLKQLINDGASISAAAREVGMSRVTAYKYLAG
jgi:DNA invertase Pin-like site-specific DNA recombinase